MKKDTNLKERRHWLSYLLGAVLIFMLIIVGIRAILIKTDVEEKTVERNFTEISNMEFNMLPYVVANIPETDTRNGFIVRAGYQNDYKLAFNDYTNNNIYVFTGYNLYGTFEDSVLDIDYGLFVINKESSSIDNIFIDNNKPSVKESVYVENLSKFIGNDKENSLLFLTTKDNNLLCYDMKKNKLVNHNSKDLDFQQIHNELNEKGNVIDFLFLENYILPNGDTEKGVYLSYQNNSDKKITDIFYKFNPDTFTFEKL